MPTTLTNGIQLPDKGSVDWYGSMQSNYNLIDTHLGDTDVHVTAEDKANWNSKQGSLSQAQLDAIAQVATNTDDIASLQSGKANASHTHSSNDITDIGDYATKQYVDNSISGLVDNAPAALDTLKELSTALNDDANFASTVATALSAKANSADLATVATSGSYTDLTDKPTIPTVNDATLTIQKNGVDVQTFTANASSNVTANITVPTKTSDLTNDSNFVDTSNSAVASGITSAKVTDYDSHIADTDIHVTTADKNKWNNQTYVFHYSSTALVASSTNSNTLLDNTDNLKVGDKVIDSSGVLFSITAIDTQNSTFTIGTALIDLAQDSDVVHKSRDETVAGFKQFANIRVTNSIKGINLDSTTTDLNNCYSDFAPYGESKGGNIQYYYCNTDAGTANISNLPEAKAFFLISITTRLISNSLYVKQILINSTSKTYTRYCNNSTWDSWVNETDSEYVHKSGSETVGGVKSFINYFLGKDLSGQTVDLNDCVDAYGGAIHYYYAVSNYANISNKPENKPFILESKTVRYVSSIDYIYYQKIYTADYNAPPSIYTRYYRSGSATWSNWVKDTDKFVTTDTNQTISGNKTFSSNVNVYNSDNTADTANIILKNSKAERGSTTNIGEQNIFFLDKDNAQIGNIKCEVDSNGYSNLTLQCSDTNDTSSGVQIRKTATGVTFQPTSNSQCYLGQPIRRWYSTYTSRINGVEPSSLSLPSGRSARIDISSYFTNTGTGNTNDYSVPANGFIFLNLLNAFAVICYSIDGTNNVNYAQSYFRQVDGQIYILFPVRKNDTFRTLWTSNGGTITVTGAYFIPCQGNV